MMKAEKDLSKAIFLKPTFDAAYDLRGRVYQDLKKYDCALTDFGRAVTLTTDPLYLKSRADLYILMGRIEDAKHDMDLLKKLQRM
jgi:tetratricopeptide (TPR) repeat protein